MGNVMRDDDPSKPAVDWVPCTNVGVEMRSADGGWSDELEEALQEWREKKTVCEFMEWHTDQLFVPVVPTLTAIYCKTAGGASTAFASGVNGLRTLPPELRAAAEEATVEYHDRSTAQVDQYGKVEAKTLGSGPRHKMVQRHPHTGVEALRFGGLQGIRTIVGMEEEEGQRLAWQIMRHATRDENSCECSNVCRSSAFSLGLQNHEWLLRADYHPWQAGELIVWDQRLVFHSRVPYDADPANPREVWRVSFLPDRADWELNRGLESPQLNIGGLRPEVTGQHAEVVNAQLSGLLGEARL